ncbi:PKD domain-containing protein [Foetidibacter luteolus]|uniref:PKD domain-containing protein n=1 Tax=Foetidibacter luteolus TaxID=2608880 RepID=UPI00129B0898|nr:PKD domain-containing protein [Foetidibacter luteolus]
MPLKKSRLKLSVLFAACLLWHGYLFAQTADFTADKAGGCSPLDIRFTNTSTGMSASATYSWDFGNGNTSTLTNPGTTYKEEKTYSVKLTVKDAGKAYTKSMNVTVYKKPSVDFTVDVSKGCLPLPVTFKSTSTPGDGSISNYFWDFGDGSTQPGSQPSEQHTYNTPQTVTASLTITNSHGCFNTLSKSAIVKVLPPVKADFKIDKAVLCRVTDAAKFTNTSTGSGTLTYSWDFGDGKTSTDKDPSHVYGAKGTYTVKLTVKSSDGCTDVITRDAVVNVANFKSDFDVPSLICQDNTATFTDKSNPISGNQVWLLDGNEYYYNYSQFSTTFTDGKQHKVQLVNKYGSCVDTATKTVAAKPSPKTQDFIADMGGVCGAPVTVKFKDTTASAVKWGWDFDNLYYYNFDPTAFTKDPTFTYTADGTYYVTLQVTNADGCSTFVNKTVAVYKANAQIISSGGDLACQSLTTQFSVSSDVAVTDYSWDFGDGSKSTSAKPSHTFSKPGTYNVRLDYTNANGCKGTAYKTIRVEEKPKFDFTASPGTTICGNTPVTFVVTGTNLGFGNFLWNFGENEYYGYYANNTHQYYHDSTYTISLIVDNNGCRDTVTKKNYVKVLPPFPKIASVMNTCDGTRGEVTFTETSDQAKGWSWDFGDGSAATAYTTAKPEVKHTYTQTGAYKVVLTATNGGCSVRDSVTAYVLLKQKPLLAAQSSQVCSDRDLFLNITQMEHNPYYSYYYEYQVVQALYGDGTPYNSYINIMDYYWSDGYQFFLRDLDVTKKDLQVITRSDYFNCLDTTNMIPLVIKGPTAGFEVVKDNICFKSPVELKDTSKAGGSVPIEKWEWDYGDGITETLTKGGLTKHTYSNPGYYYVTLKVTDKDGCTDADNAYHSVTVNGPKASFYMSDNPVLPNTTVTFYNTSNTYGTNYYDNSFTWHFGDGTSTVTNLYDYPWHTYTETGIDTVMLIASAADKSCTDTAVQYLQVKNINLAYTYTTAFVNPSTGCPPVIASFVNTSINTSSISWSFGDGSTADNINFASHVYEKPGVYKVTLYGHFADGSIDSTFEYITIKGPYATLYADKMFSCGSADTIKLHVEAYNTSNYLWDFGDGTTIETADTFAVHSYLTPGVYNPAVIPKDGSGCPTNSFYLDNKVVIDTLSIAIKTQPPVVCDSSTVFFTIDMLSVAKNQLQETMHYHWDFGAGNVTDTANTEDPAFVYNNTGNYTVKLKVASPYGCVDETDVNILVKPTARGIITGPPEVCQDLFAAFTATTNIPVTNATWQWQFQGNAAATQQNPPAQQFIQPGPAQVRLVVNNDGCYDTAYHNIIVNAKPFIDILPKQPHVCVGGAVQLQAHDGVSFTWSPAADIDNPNIANPFVSPAATSMYAVDVTNAKGCSSRDSVTVLVIQRFTVAVDSPVHLCQGSTLMLKATGADSYRWIDGSNLDNPQSGTPVTNTTVPRTYTVVGYDNYGCFTDTAQTMVLIDPLPTVNAGDDIITPAGSAVELISTASSDVVSWAWQPSTYLTCSNCASPVSIPRSDITYVVEVATAQNCRAKDSVSIKIVCKASLVQIPTAFTPNGDMRNDYFKITGQGIKLIKHFVIFGRLGDKVFEKNNVLPNDFSAGWDGKYQNRTMPTGTYVFMAEVICDTGETYNYKGTVTLIR